MNWIEHADMFLAGIADGLWDDDIEIHVLRTGESWGATRTDPPGCEDTVVQVVGIKWGDAVTWRNTGREAEYFDLWVQGLGLDVLASEYPWSVPEIEKPFVVHA